MAFVMLMVFWMYSFAFNCRAESFTLMEFILVNVLIGIPVNFLLPRVEQQRLTCFGDTLYYYYLDNDIRYV
jgi:hypothetical protein